MDDNPLEVPMGKRVNFSFGMLLTVDEFTQEFSYLRDRMHMLARELIGRGTVSGLQVSPAVEKEAAGSIRVNAGLAVDGEGHLIYLESPVLCPLPQNGTTAYLVLGWAERGTDPVPLFGTGDEDEQRIPSRIEELAVLRYETSSTLR